MKKTLKPDTNLVPVPAVMVSCGDMENSNIITIAWTGIINSNPPMIYISIRDTRYSYDIIKDNKEFVVNIPSENLIWETDFCGTKSGRNIDKFKEAKLTKERCTKVKAPSILECPINLECKVREIKKLGSHDMFIAEIVAVNAEEKYILDGKLNLDKLDLITYVSPNYNTASKKIGERGISLK